MIVYTSKECTLQIPKGLGNFAADSVDIEPLSGSVVELSATTVNLSGAVETLNKSVDSQGDAIADLLLDVDGLDTRVSGNTEDIAALSAQTTANTAHIETLSASTVAMNNSVTANTANIATLSGITSGLAVSVETLGKVKEDIYVYLKDLNAMTKEEKTVAWEALEEKYLAGHSIYLVGKWRPYDRSYTSSCQVSTLRRRRNIYRILRLLGDRRRRKRLLRRHLLAKRSNTW